MPQLDLSQIKTGCEKLELSTAGGYDSVDVRLPDAGSPYKAQGSKHEHSERYDTTPERMHEQDHEDPVQLHLMTLQQYEQGLIDVLKDLSYDIPEDNPEEFEPVEPVDPELLLYAIKAENEMLYSELAEEKRRKNELQQIILDNNEERLKNELKLGQLGKYKAENADLLKTQAFLLSELK